MSALSNYPTTLVQCILVKGEVSREFGVKSKASKRFFYQQKPKSIAQICCKLSPQ